MKKAVKHLEQFLERRRLHQGQGRARDRVRRRPRHRQVARQHDSLQQRLHRVRPRQAGAGEHDHRQGDRGRRRRDRSLRAARVHVQADAALRAGARQARHADPGAHRRRGDQSPLRAAGAVRRGERPYEPGVFYCKDAFEGLETMDGLQDADRRAAFVAKLLDDARNDVFLHTNVGKDIAVGRSRAASAATSRADNAVPTAPFFGTRVVRDIPLDEVFELLDLDELFRLQWGGRGSGPEYEATVREEFEPTLERLKDEAKRDGWIQPQAVYGYFPVQSDGNDLVVYEPERVRRATARSRRSRASTSRGRKVASVSASPTTSARRSRRRGRRRLPDRDRRRRRHATLSRSCRRRRIHRGVLLARPRRRIRGGGGRVDAPADSSRARRSGRPGQAILVGLRRVSRISRIMRSCSSSCRRRSAGDGADEAFQLIPEQSTAAMIVHHPEAKYYAVRGRAPANRPRTATGAAGERPHEHRELDAASRSRAHRRVRRRDGDDAVREGRVHQPVLRRAQPPRARPRARRASRST